MNECMHDIKLRNFEYKYMYISMGGGDINDNNFLLNITVDIKVVLFSLTHAGFILTCFVNFKINMYYALLHKLLCM